MRARMTDHRRARLRRTERADLAECRFHFVDHEIDHVAGPFRAERAQAPQEGFAGKRRVGPERHRAHDVEA